MRNTALTCLALVAALAFLPSQTMAETQAIEEKHLVSGKQVLDPSRGYIFVHAPMRQAGLFMKAPNAEEIAEYEAEWREKFTKAQNEYPKKYDRWKRDYELLKDAKHSRLGKEPIEPKEENFSIGPIETRHLAGFGPQYIFSKNEGYFSYLTEVDPGTYTYYGPLALAAGVYGGVCYCMGSVKFEVRPGVITNLGNFLSLRWLNQEQARASAAFDWIEPLNEPIDYALPASLGALPSERAVLRAAGKMNNFYGVGIRRMPPVPGVLAYERDVVIDLVAKREEEARAVREAAEEAARAERERLALLAAEQAAAVEAAAPLDGTGVEAEASAGE